MNDLMTPSFILSFIVAWLMAYFFALKETSQKPILHVTLNIFGLLFLYFYFSMIGNKHSIKNDKQKLIYKPR